MSVSRGIAILTLAIVVAFAGLILTRHVIAVAGEADAERLNRSILDYVAQKNPQAPISAFRRFPDTLLREAQRSSLETRSFSPDQMVLSTNGSWSWRRRRRVRVAHYPKPEL